MEVIERDRASGASSARAVSAVDEPSLLERWLHRPGTARVILLVSLLVTALAWYVARQFAQVEARQRFERRADDIQGRIDRRMASYEAMLRGGVALLAADPALSRAQWHAYVATVRPELNYPGIQGFGVARLIQPRDLAAHERAVREEGFPEYSVRPPGPRDLYTSIIFLEPFVTRNLRAFGFDMMSEGTRRVAMERARDTGEPAASGIVKLVQEDGKNVQKGFLMYLPVYDGGQARPEKLWGWVYAPFRVGDLMSGILGKDLGDVGFRIHDGPAETAAQAFYRSDGGAGQDEPAAAKSASVFTLERTAAVAGRRWTVVYEGHDFESAADAWQTHLVAVVGLSVDLILYVSIASLARRKRQFEREVVLRNDEVKARSEWLDAVAGLSPDGTLVYERHRDGLHRLVFTNPAFSDWFGLRPADLLGLTEEATDEWLQGLARDGQPMPALRMGAARIELAGPPRRVLKRGMREGERHRVYYFQDVTHETEVDALKNEFLSTAAHELRTPLASVYGFAELLQDEKLDALRRQRAAGIVYRQAGVLKHLVDELLDLARIDSRRGRDFQLERCDLRRVSELAAEALMQPGAVSRVHLALGDQPVWVDGDAGKLQQAVLNVLANALKYSQAPAAVSLSLSTTQQGQTRQAIVRVVDAGVGMTPEQCQRAFERFYRADNSGRVLGAGLGLAIVKEIVELHHGDVALHSTPGAGTQVTLRLPLRGAAPGAPRPAVAEPPATTEPAAAG